VRSLIAIGAVTVALLSGCSVLPDVRPESPPSPVPSYDGDAHLRQQATDALARWDAALQAWPGPVFLPVGPRFGQVGDWEPGHDQDILAIGAGQVVSGGLLPDPPSTTAAVRLVDGTTAQLPTRSATDALGPPALIGCGRGCEPVHITGARLVTGTVVTTRGPATAPVWEYDVAGTGVRLTRPAVTAPEVPVTPPPWDSAHPPAGIPYDAAIGSTSGIAVTVQFVGSPGGVADGPCGVDYAPEAIESANAVVIVLHEKHYTGPAPANLGCAMVGYPRTATVLLTKPLGERTILDEVQGLPVPTTRLT
jgi:hypothetical protein